jgi:DNA-binding transcriptional regulator YdaS (Cro superfamily)
MNALDKAIEVAGGVTRLAEALGVRQSVVSNWRMRGKPKGRVPADRCLAIEQATNAAVTRNDLRPDVFGAKPSRKTAKVA